jgi:uncharacterized Zn finger protein (UPF0148 family)
MAKYVCDRCGEVNPVGTVFCAFCDAFLAWDQAERGERLEGEQPASKSGEPSSVPELDPPARLHPEPIARVQDPSA